MPDFVERLARTWCVGCRTVTSQQPHVCDDITAAIREALEEAEKKVHEHIAHLRTFRLARNTYVPAIIRELEQVAAAIAALHKP